VRRQRGVALLTALVLLALVVVLATNIGFDSAMAARRSSASLGMEQGLALAQGAEALAAYALKQDDRDRDTPSDTWAQPYGPVEVVPEIGIEAQMFDEQGKFNLNTLLQKDGTLNDDSFKVFSRLLSLLQIEPEWASLLADWMDPDTNPQPSGGGEDSLYASQSPPLRSANLTITSVSELEQLPGFGRERYLKLLPHVTALPPSASTVNVCTATPYVLDALQTLGSEDNRDAVEFSRMSPEEFARSRTEGCFPDRNTFASNAPEPLTRRVSERSSFFQLRSWVRIGSARFALYSLMYRDESGQVRPIARTFGTE
jgi:general secretion pathway protein K